MDMEQRMRNALHHGADQLRLPQAGADAARERARTRSRRRQAGMGGATAMAVVVAAVVGWQQLPDHEIRFDQDGGLLGAGSGSSAASALGDLDWRETDGVVGQHRQILHSADGVYYALSTAPGTRLEDHPDGAVPQALYRSADGASWDRADLGAEHRVAGLGERDGVLYAVSTAPATSQAGSGQIGTSTDGGQTWSRADLPSAATAPDADVALAGPVVRAQIAVGESVMLARTSSTYRVAEEEVFPGEELDGTRYVRETPAGVELVGHSCMTRTGEEDAPAAASAGDVVPPGPDPTMTPDASPQEPCAMQDERVLRTVSWGELGLDGRDDLRVDELFRSTDGATWEAVDAPPLAGRDVQELAAGPQGFFAISRTHGDDGTVTVDLLRSSDGGTWERIDGAGPVTSLGFVGERIVGTATRDDGRVEAVASADGGSTWTRTDLTGLVDPDGATVAVSVVAQATGSLGAAVVAMPHTGESGTPPAADELAVLTSADGIGWSVTPVGDIVGDDVPQSISWVAVGDDSIVLSASWPRDGEAAAPTRTYVGTSVR